jgi:transposase-like protein
MEERQRRSFTDDYKRQAVDLLASSGRSIGSAAKELGLRDSVLSAEHGLPFQEGLRGYLSARAGAPRA